MGRHMGSNKARSKAQAKKEYKPKPPSPLAGKEYKEAVDEVVKNSVVQADDLDEKAIKFLDWVEENGGRSKEACQHLQKALEGLGTRDTVKNMSRYVYTLLRQFDEESYQAMKVSEGKKPRGPRRVAGDREIKSAVSSSFTFNLDTADFVPGQAAWSAVPQTVATPAPPSPTGEKPSSPEAGDRVPEQPSAR